MGGGDFLALAEVDSSLLRIGETAWIELDPAWRIESDPGTKDQNKIICGLKRGCVVNLRNVLDPSWRIDLDPGTKVMIKQYCDLKRGCVVNLRIVWIQYIGSNRVLKLK